MAAPKLPLTEAIAQWPAARPTDLADRIAKQRARITGRFPLADWPSLELERYGLGTGSQDTFCYLMEFASQDLGGIGGGSARKHLIYRRSDTGAWWFDRRFESAEQAWAKVRAGFVKAFELAAAGNVDGIQGLEPVNWAPSLTGKAIVTYFPGSMVAVYSHAAQQHFWDLLGGPGEVAWSAPGCAQLGAQARTHPGLADMDPWELAHFLYWWANPRESRRVVKIAPGHEAKFWDECRDGGFICVGWDKVPSLTDFDAKDEFRSRFNDEYREQYGSEAKLSAKANELWTLRELEPGDIVVANRGKSHVLALGTVVDPGYEYRGDRPEWRHTVRVEWDTSYEQDIDAIGSWGVATVAKVPYTLLHKIQSGRGSPVKHGPSGLPAPAPAPTVPVDPLLEEIDDALVRKGQAILYGPPGTGKTYHSNRFAAWWLLHRLGRADATAPLADAGSLASSDRELTTSRVQRRTWWVVANPAVWSWDQLFKDGRVDYDYGRIRANYGAVQPGDLVVGYQANPDKRIVALGKVTEGLHEVDGELKIVLEPIARVANGPGYDELTRDDVLATSEPIRNRNQGTLFKLTVDEADYLLSLLAERNPGLPSLDADDAEVGHLTRVTFHPSYSYEDFVEGYKPVDTGTGTLVLRMVDGVFKRVCRTAAARPDETYLLLIDEINRGNIPKIFGELITLLELDKRGMSVILPQSREAFSIPKNVFVVGTMNTADRSIKLLDAALRRRFAFIELMPDPEVLRGGIIDGLDLEVFLEELNHRIAQVEGREKQIGHSYLLSADGQPVGTAEEFSRRFRHEILPLLQEYAYEDYAELEAYVGKGIVDAKELRLKASTLGDPDQLVAALRESFMGDEAEVEAESAG